MTMVFPDAGTLGLFVLAAVAMLLSPGPAVLFIVARSLQHGRVAGLISVLGVTAGGAVHVLAATLGLTALISSSAVAYQGIRYAGAAYLIYLGIQRWRTPVVIASNERVAPAKLSRVWLDGFIVNLLNPKTALFFLAFIPQFTDPARGNVSLQFLFLGAVFLVLAFVCDGSYALASGSVRHWAKSRRAMDWMQRRIPAVTYAGLGVLTATLDLRDRD